MIIAKLELYPLYYVWNHPIVYQSSHFKNGQKGTVAKLLSWKYKDAEQECEKMAKAGYLGGTAFPPQESMLEYQHPENEELNPWYWIYQPVSYHPNSCMDTVEELRKIINICRSKGLKVYADAVINHMSGNGNDMFSSNCYSSIYWGNKIVQENHLGI